MSHDVSFPDLPGWLASQRWFSGKDQHLDGAEVSDVVAVTADGPWLAVVTTTLGSADGVASTARWLLCLAPTGPDDVRAIGEVDGTPVADIADRPDAAAALLGAITSQRLLRTAAGAELRCVSGPGEPEGGAEGAQPMGARLMGVEQSNTSIVLGDAQVLKVVRRLVGGPNPEVELTTLLTRSAVRGVPALHGAILGPGEEALVVVQAFVPGARGAWELAVEEATGRIDHGVANGMGDLGGLLRHVHDALGTAGSMTLDRAGLRALSVSIRAAAERARRLAESAGARVPGDLDDVISASLAAAATTLRTGAGLQRIHGDLHLGQVIRDPEGMWWVLDFEGEPGREIPERRRLRHPAYDVAGMTRSIDYARAVAVRGGGDPTACAEWAAHARATFLEGHGTADDDPWLRLLEIDKLLYEVGYEAANRPDWLDIPLRALSAIGSDMTAPAETGPGDTPAVDRTPAATPTVDPPPAAVDDTVRADAALLEDGRLHEPHRLLGRHPVGGAWVLRCWRPGATAVAVTGVGDGEPVEADEVAPGLFAAPVPTSPDPSRYRYRVTYPDGNTFEVADPYAYPPTLGDVDMHLLAEGRHEQAWTVMGANTQVHEGQHGTAFAVWAPNARQVRLVGEFNSWDGRLHPMRSLGSSGIWELFVPDIGDGTRYKFEIVTSSGDVVLRADPWAKWAEVPPGTASRVFTSEHSFVNDRPAGDHLHEPMSVYEVHLGSWRHTDAEHGGRRPLTYAELAEELGSYVVDMGFTHVELLPVAEHPFGGSWGYQVTGQFAPTSRFGTPDDFRQMVDHLHGLGIGVIVDWVPAHFPKDEWALARFDGTALYEHADPRQGEHPDWGTLVFNYGRREVRNFLVASALCWIESLGVDGLRVDAVASMLYLDYSRKAGEWVPNEHGGRENLRAVELLQEVNATTYRRNPTAFTVAEESTAWPGVSRPTHLGGLGFGFKWNMGWMHDTLSYFTKEPIYRRWHHNQLTFGMMYAWSEHFLLPLSHDEVVHGKGSLIGKMPGDRWQQMANLRALYGWMWGHPGKKLLFMGGEIAQDREWSEERDLDWWCLGDGFHSGMQSLVRDANHTYRSLGALWRRDDDPTSFSWIDANNADDNLLSFVRHGAEGDDAVAVIANLSPTPRHDVRIGLPARGFWREALNTDSEAYGGSNVGNLGGVVAHDIPMHGFAHSAEVTVPPLGVVWLAAGDRSG